MEHLFYVVTFALPLTTSMYMGGYSTVALYLYFISFDILNMAGHCNWEFMPYKLYNSIPGLKYLLYTST